MFVEKQKKRESVSHVSFCFVFFCSVLLLFVIEKKSKKHTYIHVYTKNTTINKSSPQSIPSIHPSISQSINHPKVEGLAVGRVTLLSLFLCYSFLPYRSPVVPISLGQLSLQVQPGKLNHLSRAAQAQPQTTAIIAIIISITINSDNNIDNNIDNNSDNSDTVTTTAIDATLKGERERTLLVGFIHCSTCLRNVVFLASSLAWVSISQVCGVCTHAIGR